MKEYVANTTGFVYLCSKVIIQSSEVEILELYEEMNLIGACITASNNGGWHSSYKLHQSNSEKFTSLANEILELANYLLKKNKLINDTTDSMFTQFWVNVNEENHWNTPHTHIAPEGSGLDTPTWSGIYYVSVEGESNEAGKNIGGELLLFSTDDKGNIGYRTHKPKNGQFLLFKPNLLHMVSPSKSKQKRISIAFNLKEINVP